MCFDKKIFFGISWFFVFCFFVGGLLFCGGGGIFGGGVVFVDIMWGGNFGGCGGLGMNWWEVIGMGCCMFIYKRKNIIKKRKE